MKNLIPSLVVILMLPVASMGQSCTDCMAAAGFRFDVTYDPTGFVVGVNCKLPSKDFGVVDPGLKKSHTITLSNCRDFPRKVTPSVAFNPAGSNLAWDFSSLLDIVDASGQFSLAADVTAPFEISFKPLETTPVGLYEAVVTLAIEDTDYGPTIEYEFTFTASCDKITLTAVLVVDRSGSMATAAYSGATISKIAALQQAISLFYEALMPYDRVGVVKYNSTAETYLAIDNRPSDLDTNPIPELDPAATTNAAQLGPSGTTAIGRGLEHSLSLLSPETTSNGRKKVLVLQTDGIENVFDPAAEDVPIPSDHSLYTVGLGHDVQFSMLQALATSGADGSYQVINEPNADMTLSKFYFQILASARDNALVNDPYLEIDLQMPDTVMAFSSAITSSDISAEFLILDRPEMRGYYDVSLVNPKGEVISAGSVIGGQPVKVFQRHNYKLYRVNGLGIASDDEDSFRGLWKVMVNVKGECKSDNNRSVCKAPLVYVCSAASNLKIDVTALSETYLPGAPVVLTAKLSESLLPVPEASVDVRIKGPGKYPYHVKLNDVGLDNDQIKGDGIYTGTFRNTGISGVYEFYFAALVKNRSNEITTREDLKYVSMRFPRQSPVSVSGPVCNLCWWHWVMLVAVVAVLLIGIARIIYRSV